MAPDRNSRNEPLLPTQNNQENTKSDGLFSFNLKTALALILIFLICAPIAYLLMDSFMYHFYPGVERIDASTITEPVKIREHVNTKRAMTIKSKFKPRSAASCGKRIIGYYTGYETPEVTENQLQKLTHVIYLFAMVQPNGTVKFEDLNTERRFLDLRNLALAMNSRPNLMISVKGSDRYSLLVSNEEKKKILIESIASFITEHDLDGLEIYWKWPSASDQRFYTVFIRDLRIKLTNLKRENEKSDAYLISVLVPPSISSLETTYDLSAFLTDVDFLNVRTYDYDQDKHRIGPHAPLFGGHQDNIDSTMKYLVCKTKQPRKLNSGLTLYGTIWKNTDLPFRDDSDDIWIETDNRRGFSTSNVEWGNLTASGWDKQLARFHEASKSSYIWIEETRSFMTFDNERSLLEKAKYVREHGIGGITVRSIDQDDEENTFLNVISSVDVCSRKEKDVKEYVCPN